MRVDRAVVAVVLGGVLAAAPACGASEDSKDAASPEPSGQTQDLPAPSTRSVYMDQVVERYNTLHTKGEAPWKSVVAQGRRWTGDPTTYEKVCGASFLAADGTVPGFYSDAANGQTWYDALRADPKKWAAFNAWIADPAVKRAVSDTALNVEAGGGTGGKPDIGDYSACTAREDAGVPVS